MENPTVITEKVYCHDCGYGYNHGNDAAWLMASQNQWGNNPFAYAFLMGMMRFMYGNDWQNQMPYNAEMQSRFNQLSNQISDNHNTDILNEAVKGNTARIGELANTLNIDHRAIQSGICDLRAAIQQQGGDIRAGIQGLQGDVRFTGERVINSGLMGMKDLQATFKDCCCQSKELIQRMGYENQLAQKDTLNAMGQQTYTLNERLTGIANGIQKGFSDIGYLLAQNKGEIINNQDRNTQRVVDTMKDHWTAELSQENQNLRFAVSQKEQNEYLLDKLTARFSGCGCGCGAA